MLQVVPDCVSSALRTLTPSSDPVRLTCGRSRARLAVVIGGRGRDIARRGGQIGPLRQQLRRQRVDADRPVAAAAAPSSRPGAGAARARAGRSARPATCTSVSQAARWLTAWLRDCAAPARTSAASAGAVKPACALCSVSRDVGGARLGVEPGLHQLRLAGAQVGIAGRGLGGQRDAGVVPAGLAAFEALLGGAAAGRVGAEQVDLPAGLHAGAGGGGDRQAELAAAVADTGDARRRAAAGRPRRRRERRVRARCGAAAEASVGLACWAAAISGGSAGSLKRCHQFTSWSVLVCRVPPVLPGNGVCQVAGTATGGACGRSAGRLAQPASEQGHGDHLELPPSERGSRPLTALATSDSWVQVSADGSPPAQRFGLHHRQPVVHQPRRPVVDGLQPVVQARARSVR